MPARIGNIPLNHHVATRLDTKDLEKLNEFSEAHGFKRCTLIRLVLREYISKIEPSAGQLSTEGSILVR
jgi:metal-responsive CopG/Arc/MetJ family transcriptional regulator